MEKKFNNIYFESLIHDYFEGNVMGYSVAIVNKDGIQAKVSGGWAQVPGDGNVPMKTYIASNIGSCTKVLSGIALLNLINQHKLADRSVNEQLDMPIWRKLPPKWHSEILPENKLITYRHLLQHKSGMPENINPSSQYNDKLLYFFTKTPSPNHDREYSNANFSILVFLIPAIAYPNEFSNAHDVHKNKNIHDYSSEMRSECGRLFRKYMLEEIFPKALGNIRPSCDPERELDENSFAKQYSSVSDQNGTIPDRSGNRCVPQGGYYVNSQDLANFMCTVAYTNKYIGPALKDLLYDPANGDDRLVFGMSIRHEGFGDEVGQNMWAYQGGDAGNYHAAILKLPYDYYGIGMVNSHVFNKESKTSFAVARGIVDAFFTATREIPIILWRHGITENEYERIANDIREHGSRIRYADFYEVGGEMFVNAIFRPFSGDMFARHDLTSTEYQAIYDDNPTYNPVQIKSYKKDGTTRYAIVMERNNDLVVARHSLASDRLDDLFNEWRPQGFVPYTISAITIGNDRYYTVALKKEMGINWEARGFIRDMDLENTVDTMKSRGFLPDYISAFKYNGDNYFSVIFRETRKRVLYVFGYGPIRYQEEFDTKRAAGYSLHSITGYANGDDHRFAAIWIK